MLTFWELEKSSDVVNYYSTISAQETKQTIKILKSVDVKTIIVIVIIIIIKVLIAYKINNDKKNNKDLKDGQNDKLEKKETFIGTRNWSAIYVLKNILLRVASTTRKTTLNNCRKKKKKQ